MRDKISLFLLLFLVFITPKSFAEQITIIAFGDSTTAGTPGFFSPAEAPPDGQGNPESQYAYWLMKKHPEWNVINRGIRAQRSDQMLQRMESDIFAYQPKAAVVLAGVVDIYQNRTAEEVEANLAEIYRRLKERGIKVVACSITPYLGSSPLVQGRMNQLNAWIRDYAGKNGMGFSDIFHAVENPERPHTLRSSPDGLHPDVDGYRRMAEAVAPELEKLL